MTDAPLNNEIWPPPPENDNRLETYDLEGMHMVRDQNMYSVDRPKLRWIVEATGVVLIVAMSLLLASILGSWVFNTRHHHSHETDLALLGMWLLLLFTWYTTWCVFDICAGRFYYHFDGDKRTILTGAHRTQPFSEFDRVEVRRPDLAQGYHITLPAYPILLHRSGMAHKCWMRFLIGDLRDMAQYRTVGQCRKLENALRVAREIAEITGLPFSE